MLARAIGAHSPAVAQLCTPQWVSSPDMGLPGISGIGYAATAWDPDGLPKRSVRKGSMASTASGRIGVVAAWSR